MHLYWPPPFINEIVSSHLRHLFGVAVKDDRLQSATALGISTSEGGWREHKADGGIVIDIDIPSDDVQLAGLSMPHSPRWHNDRLWLLNSGKGELLCLERNAHYSRSGL